MSHIPLRSPSEWKYFYSLWRQRSWMIRRVDRVSVVDRDRTQLNMTFTIDNRRIRDYLRENGFDETEINQIPLPLFLWGKEPVLDVDVKSGSGRRLPVASKDANTYFARCVLLAQAKMDELDGWGCMHRFARFHSDLDTILVQNDLKRLTAMVDDLERLTVDSLQLTEFENEQLQYFRYWVHFLTNVDGRLLSTFMHSYVFLVYIDFKPDSDIQVISCRFVYKNKFVLGRPKPGRVNYRHNILSTGFDGVDRRVHVRVEAPEGLRISRIELIDQRQANKRYTNKDVQSILTPNLVELVRTRDASAHAMNLRVYYMPQRSAFIVPSMFLAVAYAFSLVVSLLFICFNHEVPTPSPFAGVGLLAIGSAFLTRDFKHDIAAHVCERSRNVFAIISLSIFVYSIMIGVIGTHTTAVFGLIILAAVLIYIASTGIAIWRMCREVKRGCRIES